MRVHSATLTGLHARLMKMRRNGITGAAALQLQTDVLRAIRRNERRIRKLREMIANDRARLGSEAGLRLSRTDAHITKNRILRRTDRVDQLRSALALTRSITDGLAFSVVDKWDIKPLSFKEPAGFVSGKAGLGLELRTLRALALRGRVVIMNDLTNCIRYGDLTVSGYPTPAILEIKSSGVDNPRVRRQSAKAEKIAEYLRSDVSANWQGSGWTAVRTALHSAERTHRRRLVRLIEAAKAVGHSISWPEPGLCYCCVGASSMLGQVRSLKSRFKQPPIAFPLFPAASFPNYYYPLSLSIADSWAWWSVVSGQISVVVLIDPERVRALGRSLGLEMALLDDPEWTWQITGEANPTLGSFRISRQFFGRVAGEFLSLRWFVEEIAARFRGGPPSLDGGPDTPTAAPS